MKGLFFALALAACSEAKVCSSSKKYPIELVIVQDATASFSDDFAQMKEKQLSQIKKLFSSYPGSRFGVVSFRDKPIQPVGWPATDYCVKYELPLTENFSGVEKVYQSLMSIGGGDGPENSIGALLSTALSPTVGWSKDPKYTKIMLLVTDAWTHEAGEKDKLNLGLRDHAPMTPDDEDPAKCAEYFYPSYVDLVKAIKDKSMYMLSLIQGDDSITKGWKWFNDDILGQPENFVQNLSSDSSNFAEILSNVMAIVDQIECNDNGESNPPPQGPPDSGNNCPECPAVPAMPAVCKDYLNDLLKFYNTH